MKDLLLKRPKAFAIYIFACFILVVGDLLGPWCFALLIGSIEKGDLNYFYRTVALCMVIAVISISIFICSRFLRIGYMRDTLLDVRTLAFDRILKMSYEKFNQSSKEIYVSNLINDINTFEQNFFLKLLNIIYQGGKYVFSILILIIIDPLFGLGTASISLLVYAISSRFENQTVKLQTQVSQYNEAFTLEASNTLNGLEILKLNRVEDLFLNKTIAAIDKVERKKLHFAVFTESQRGVTRFLSNFIFVGMMVYLLTQAYNNVSLTQIALLLQLGGGCIWPIGYVLPMFNELKASLAIFDKICTPETTQEESVKSNQPYAFENDFSIRNLNFSYDGKSALRVPDLSLERGKKYLIKGASGAGKSTLLKLLSKIYENYEGDILLDQVPLSHIDEVDFNRHIAFIYQDVFLFEDTIRNNITLFKEATDEELEQVIRQAGLEDLIQSKPNGLDEMLSENGKNLSGGQRQRISIARAIFKKADILFVDEGTSSLNEELGRDIESTILSLDCTVVAISHRYYAGITEQYDHVLEIADGDLTAYTSELYFEGVAV